MWRWSIPFTNQSFVSFQPIERFASTSQKVESYTCTEDQQRFLIISDTKPAKVEGRPSGQNSTIQRESAQGRVQSWNRRPGSMLHGLWADSDKLKQIQRREEESDRVCGRDPGDVCENGAMEEEQVREEAEEGRALSFHLGILFANPIKDFFPSSAPSSFFPPRPDRIPRAGRARGDKRLIKAWVTTPTELQNRAILVKRAKFWTQGVYTRVHAQGIRKWSRVNMASKKISKSQWS